MSDCCKACIYKARQAIGETACPFNSLYWDFLARNEPKLRGNPRMNLMLGLLDRRDPEELAAVRAHAAEIKARLWRGERF
jgi:deoxyribodipyrimidine photolyase-related protein